MSNLECGIALFPKVINEDTVHTLAKWVDHNITKMVFSSVWMTNTSESYNEATLVPSSHKKRKVSHLAYTTEIN